MLNNLVGQLASWPNSWKRALIVSVDSAIIMASISLAVILIIWPSIDLKSIFLDFTIYSLPIISYFVFRAFRVHRSVIRFLTGRLAWTIIKASLVAHSLFSVVVYFSPGWSSLQNMPGVLIFSFLFSVFFLVGTRYWTRSIIDKAPVEEAERSGERSRVAIYGLTASAREFARTISLERKMRPVLFLTDEAGLANSESYGADIRLAEDPARLLAVYKVDRLVIAEDAVTAVSRQKLLDAMYDTTVPIHILPAPENVFGNRPTQSMLRRVRVEDLLKRPQHELNENNKTTVVKGKTVLVTGAAGSIGNQLCRTILQQEPKNLLVLDQSEADLVELVRSLSTDDKTQIVSVLGSLLDEKLIDEIFKTHKVDIIFHAAAYKHVDIAEKNIITSIKNNVLSTYYLTNAALKAKVPSMVLISTDKAVKPKNVMGASKRWSELIVCGLAEKLISRKARSKGAGGFVPRYCVVRFGNVFRSSGSVVPLFEDQLMKGGPITITDFEMTRYFMSVEEAAGLILKALGLCRGGEVFLLSMGKPVRILDIAKMMVRFAGRTIKSDTHPDGEIAIVETGIRSGEKLHEQLHDENTEAFLSDHPSIMFTSYQRKNQSPKFSIDQKVKALNTLLDIGDQQKAKNYLYDFIRITDEK